MNLSFLDGLKTYIIAGAVLLAVAVEKLLGWDIPGIEVGEGWLEYVMAALGLSALRSGITKSGPV